MCLSPESTTLNLTGSFRDGVRIIECASKFSPESPMFSSTIVNGLTFDVHGVGSRAHGERSPLAMAAFEVGPRRFG